MPNNNDTQIIYFGNETDDSITVLVFPRPYPTPLTVEAARKAWQVLRIPPGSSIMVNYSIKNQIVAYYYTESGDLISAGPYEAETGSTWIASTESGNTISLTKKGKQR